MLLFLLRKIYKVIPVPKHPENMQSVHRVQAEIIQTASELSEGRILFQQCSTSANNFTARIRRELTWLRELVLKMLNFKRILSRADEKSGILIKD